MCFILSLRLYSSFITSRPGPGASVTQVCLPGLNQQSTAFRLISTFKFVFLVVSSEPSANKKALKIIKLQERGINVITTTDR